MAIAPVRRYGLLDCDGFRVVGAEGNVGVVEEVWLGEDGEPTALAVRTDLGPRGLLLADGVSAVERERRWVVVDPGARLLELEVPRLVQGEAGRPAASWATSGSTLPVFPPAPRAVGSPRAPAGAEPSLVRSVVFLYAGLVAVVVAIMALAFGIADLVS